MRAYEPAQLQDDDWLSTVQVSLAPFHERTYVSQSRTPRAVRESIRPSYGVRQVGGALVCRIAEHGIVLHCNIPNQEEAIARTVIRHGNRPIVRQFLSLAGSMTLKI